MFLFIIEQEKFLKRIGINKFKYHFINWKQKND